MGRKTDVEALIHCNVCGEDYSATYRRCPFCGERVDVSPLSVDDDEDESFVFEGEELFDEPSATRQERPKGGKRLAAGGSHAARRGGERKGSRYAPPPGPTNWVRLVTFIISLVIIIAALIIVFTVIYPRLHSNPNPSTSPSTPVASQSAEPSGQPSGEPSGEPSTEPSGEPSQDPSQLSGMTLSNYDFTLNTGGFHTIQVTFDPAEWEGTVTWTSSDESIATVTAQGRVTNVNESTSLRRAIITASAGGLTQECVVYCRGVGSSTTAPPVTTTSPSPSGSLTPGSTGVITGADGGLRVRSGPGTGYSVLASLVNGNRVTIVADAGDGWYEITYSGSGGTTNNGFILGEYISGE